MDKVWTVIVTYADGSRDVPYSGPRHITAVATARGVLGVVLDRSIEWFREEPVSVEIREVTETIELGDDEDDGIGAH